LNINKNKFIFGLTVAIAASFFASSILGILDYFVVKTILFISLGIYGVAVFWQINDNYKKQKPLD